jgi:hypothetical protein
VRGRKNGFVGIEGARQIACLLFKKVQFIAAGKYRRRRFLSTGAYRDNSNKMGA